MSTQGLVNRILASLETTDSTFLHAFRQTHPPRNPPPGTNPMEPDLGTDAASERFFSQAVRTRLEGNLAEAERMLEQSLAAYRARSGEDAPETQAARGQLGRVLLARGNTKRAVQLHRELWRTRLDLYTEEHHLTQNAVVILIESLLAAGKRPEATALFQETVSDNGDRAKALFRSGLEKAEHRSTLLFLIAAMPESERTDMREALRFLGRTTLAIVSL